MTSTVKEKSVTVTASFNEVSGTTGSSWAQEVSDTAKGSKSWEIALIAVLLAIGAITLVYFVIRCPRRRRSKDVQPPGLDVPKV
ncbi:hypothetical protein I307_05720 [Cryptococcus deuterogattii 99/473]|uniref:Uncharacterized protein n=1 Tax=Cryptococcus deuterogattii Ram5 TaxID=1296110 RepID=A0A0D0V4Y3_9TREE|nr:hypothetical protein I309_05868 [Cryptococcus deuterogattii LA55]KIR41644.1 hypothetical protein I313_02779 [Cryptococcus deuterogattii Ram5]KIR91468.1 hypothetical protein I304_04943 [Cryptococcus deuterogattii CBS 10090]KIR98343.1 hypothetical protein L804_03911 [Cryptococcus deuterogattii 2001/935-1]KIY54959.1 hypothetical protein I307_05720 [Cryptococcus deuterogattii 99/473]